MREAACPYGAAYEGALGKCKAPYVVGDGRARITIFNLLVKTGNHNMARKGKPL